MIKEPRPLMLLRLDNDTPELQFIGRDLLRTHTIVASNAMHPRCHPPRTHHLFHAEHRRALLLRPACRSSGGCRVLDHYGKVLSTSQPQPGTCIPA